jgi:hypothetical protein
VPETNGDGCATAQAAAVRHPTNMHGLAEPAPSCAALALQRAAVPAKAVTANARKIQLLTLDLIHLASKSHEPLEAIFRG